MGAALRATIPNFAAVNAASNGNNTLVAAQTNDPGGSNAKIRVMAMCLVASAPVVANVQSGAGGTTLTGALTGSTGTQMLTLPYSEEGWFETAAGSLLNLNLSGATQVSGCVVWKKA